MAGSTGAVIYTCSTIWGPRGTGAVIFTPHRMVAGLYATSLTRQAAKKNWKPHALHPLTDDSGQIDPAWNRFFGDLANRKLGGALFPTVPEITAALQLGQTNATAISQIQTAQEQMAIANAQSIAAILQVIQTAGLAGAAQVPPVVLARQETNIPPAPDPLGGAGGGGGD